MNLDAIVVGGGIFGRTIALALFTQGRDVLVVDDKRPDSGSAPSGCLMKPSWFSSLGRDVYDPSLELLDSLFGVEELSFKVRPSGVETKAFHVPAKKILCCHGYPEMLGTVRGISKGIVHVTQGMLRQEHYLEAPLVVVAAGVWCSELMKVDGLVGKKGVSFRWGGSCRENLINVWAPYKQLVVFQEQEDQVWGGDGAAILPKNWTNHRQWEAMNRVMKAAKVKGWPELGPPNSTETITGIRPYIPGVKPCLLEERAPGLWLCTGGAKNGTIAAGWAASELLRRTS